MLGISVTEAVAVSTLLLGLAAFWKGMRAGEAAKVSNAAGPAATASLGAAVLADSLAMEAMTEAINRIADAIDRHHEQALEEKKDRLSVALELLVERLDNPKPVRQSRS